MTESQTAAPANAIEIAASGIPRQYSKVKRNKARAAALASIDSEAGAGEPYKALIINLESSIDRLQNICGHLKRADVEFERVPGLRGSDLSSYGMRRLAPNWNGVKNHLGTLGCFLGHIRAWEKVANGEGRGHLVLEDDAIPCGALPRSISALHIPQDFDLCFCNTRMERVFRQGETFPAHPTSFSAMEARSSLRPTKKAIGGEAYFLSKAGAVKALQAVDRIGPFMHVDWFLFVLGIDEEAAKAFRGDDRAAQLYNRVREQFRPVRDIEFRTIALWPALMDRARGIESTRRAENAV